MSSLKAIRVKKGVKQLAVAKHLGVSRTTYAKYEENQDNMSIGQAKAVCDFLGCEVEEIFLSCNVGLINFARKR